MSRRKREPKPEKLNPRIIEEHNEIDGRVRWRVWLNGWHVSGLSKAPEEAIFDNREDAEQYYADRYGWAKTKEYQPDAQR